jgi:hypothetical protein
MGNLTPIALGATGLLFVALPIPSQAQDCRALGFACEHKDELGLQGAGTCRRFDAQCRDVRERPISDPAPNQCRQPRWACEHKDQLGLQGAGACRELALAGVSGKPADSQFARGAPDSAPPQALLSDKQGAGAQVRPFESSTARSTIALNASDFAISRWSTCTSER